MHIRVEISPRYKKGTFNLLELKKWVGYSNGAENIIKLCATYIHLHTHTHTCGSLFSDLFLYF